MKLINAGPVSSGMGDRLRGPVSHLLMYPAEQADSASYPPWDGKMIVISRAN